jgi:hypothetical protein
MTHLATAASAVRASPVNISRFGSLEAKSLIPRSRFPGPQKSGFDHQLQCHLIAFSDPQRDLRGGGRTLVPLGALQRILNDPGGILSRSYDNDPR